MADIELALAYGIRDIVMKVFDYTVAMKRLDVRGGRAWMVKFGRAKVIIVCQVSMSAMRPRIVIPLHHRDGASPIYVLDDAESAIHDWSRDACCYLRELSPMLVDLMRSQSRFSPPLRSSSLVSRSPSPASRIIDDEGVAMDDMRDKKMPPARTARNARFIPDD